MSEWYEPTVDWVADDIKVEYERDDFVPVKVTLYLSGSRAEREAVIGDMLQAVGSRFAVRPHDHRGYVEGCFRCDLSRMEVG
jgi:hypothetical protein